MQVKNIIGTLFFTLSILFLFMTGKVFAYCGGCSSACSPPPCTSICVLPAVQRFCFHTHYARHIRGTGEEQEYEWVPDPLDP